MGAFGDGNKHDIHDANAADDEADAGNESKHTRDDVKESAGGMGNLVAVRNGPVVIAIFLFDEGLFYAGGGGGDGAGTSDFDVDLLNLDVLV